jgi:2Fe-2S ferredoxin
MPKVTFTIPDRDKTITLHGDEGTSLMKLAVAHDVPGIDGECGGEMSCGTCHVHVAPEWADRLEPASPDEAGMVEVLDDPRPTSRLGCQIKITAALGGIAVTVPNI